MRGVPLKAVQELLGHSTIQMTMRYAYLAPQVRQDAANLHGTAWSVDLALLLELTLRWSGYLTLLRGAVQFAARTRQGPEERHSKTNTANPNRHIRWRVCAARLSCCMTLFAVAACSRGAATTPAVTDANARRVANLHAFARLYGVVRWFHPSDAAATVDWDRFALDGAHRVVDAADQRALRATLTELFAPIAPTMHIGGAGEQPPDVPTLHPASTAGLRVVAWQHQGYGDTRTLAGVAAGRDEVLERALAHLHDASR